VLEVVYGAGGALSAFAANLEQRCKVSVPRSTAASATTPRCRSSTRAAITTATAAPTSCGATQRPRELHLPDGRHADLAGEGYLRAVADQKLQIAGTGDFDGDGKADILWRNTSTGQNYIYFMDASAQARLHQGRWLIRTGRSPHRRLRWRRQGRHPVEERGYRRELSLSDGWAFDQGNGRLSTDRCRHDWQVAGIGDFDGDGKADILWRNSSSARTTST